MSQAHLFSEFSINRDAEILEAKKSVYEVMQKHEALRIKNVEEKMNEQELEILKIHDQENIPVADIERLCGVYTQSLAQLMTGS